ncbi:MAG: cation:proton antiporter [Thermoanaerobaculia bacterium]
MEILKLLSIIFIFSTLFIFILNKFKIPSLLGFLLSGFILGPYGLKILKDMETIKKVADIGIILLLFAVGIEFSKEMVISLRKKFIISGTSQFFLTFSFILLLSVLFEVKFQEGVIAGFLITLSSTAVIFKILLDRGEMDTPQGKVMAAISLFQDLMAIPIMFVLPFFTGEKLNFKLFFLKILIGFCFVFTLFYALKNIFPKIFFEIAKTKQREIFILSILSFCLAVAYLTYLSGLSVALGAFIAGLVVAQSEFAHQAMSDILPFKESFLGIFFVSVGALLNFVYFKENIFKILLITLIIFIIKFFTGSLAGLLSGTPLKYSLQVGFGIFPIGEFSFIIAHQGLKLNLIDSNFYQVFVISSVMTIFLAPFIFKYYNEISNKIISIPFIKKRLKYHRERESVVYPRLKDHIIIIGFGLNGRNLAFVLKEAKIPYVVLELNIDTVQQELKKGEPIFYGDGSSKEVLLNLGIKNAKLLVVVISDPIAIRRIVSIAKEENPDVYIIVRTRYVLEVETLKGLGADEVIPEEFETSIEIFSRVLDRFGVPINLILNYAEKIREGSYQSLRNLSLPKKSLETGKDFLKYVEIERYQILESSKLSQKSLKEIDLRAKTGATILAIQRFEEIISNPPADFIIKAGDILILYGKSEDINSAISFLNTF